MKLGSLFDGSGTCPLAASAVGIIPAWASEVEPYPIAVTRSRFPNMKHLGSVMDIHGEDIEPVDIITFGSPCQDLSVAGKRAGLKHESNGDDETTRSGLFMEAVRIIKEMREATNGEYPTFAVWENVPGAFSSNKGEDFRTVLEELIKIVEPTATMPAVPKNGWPYADSYCGDGWGLAYRVLDAQYWGVPQRRRRIYLVLDLRGQRAREVLFERAGLQRNFAKSGTPGQAAAGDASGGSGADDRAGEGFNGYNGDLTGAVSATLGVNCGVSTGRNGAIERIGGLDAVKVYGIDHAITTGGNCTAQGPCIYEDIQATLKASGPHSVAYAVPYTLKIRSICEGGGKGTLIQENKSATLASNNDQYMFQPVAYSFDSLASNSMKSKNPHSGCRRVEIAKTLDTTDPNPSKNQGGIAVVEQYCFENHSQDTRHKGPLDVCPTLPAQLGTGGNNAPFVVKKEPVVFDGANVTSPINASNPQPGDPCHTLSTDSRNYVVEEVPVYCLQGNGIDRADTAGCNGKGWRDDVCYKLNTIDRPAVSYDAVSLLGDKVAGTLMARDYKGIGRHDTLGSAVCIPMATHYIVRRLTPTECARLQGFPDNWGHPDHKEDFTDEEYRFWLDVRNTYAAINDRPQKDYSKDQMLTWYNKLHTSSAEYKMWGNGMAFPCMLYIMEGVQEVLAERYLKNLFGGV